MSAPTPPAGDRAVVSVLVRVEPDVAEEDAVRPRDRLVSEVYGLGAGETPSEHLESILYVARTPARAPLDKEVVNADAGQLVRDLVGDPASLGNGRRL